MVKVIKGIGVGRKDFSRNVEISTVPVMRGHQDRLAYVQENYEITLGPGEANILYTAPYTFVVSDLGGYVGEYYKKLEIDLHDNILFRVYYCLLDWDLLFMGYPAHLCIVDIISGAYFYGNVSLDLLYKYEYRYGENMSTLYPEYFFRIVPTIILVNETNKTVTIKYDLTLSGFRDVLSS